MLSELPAIAGGSVRSCDYTELVGVGMDYFLSLILHMA